MAAPTLTDLVPKKRAYLRARMSNKGKSKRNAALEAGYSEATARIAGQAIETPDVKAIMRDMIQARIGHEKIVDRLAEGLDAEKTEFFTKDGVVTDTRNTIAWSERRAYLELAAEYGGYVMKEQPVAQHLHLLTVMPEPVQPQDVVIPTTAPTIDTTSTIITDTGGTPAPPAKHA